MTREEHIIYAKNLRTALNMANNFSAETMESLDAAIKALEQEPTTKNDCISRAGAIQAMQDKAKKLTNEDIINGLCGAVAILFDLPSVTLQGVSLEKLDENAKETVSHLVECYEDDCFTKDERVILAGIALQARLRFQLNKYTRRLSESEDKE